MTTPDIASVMQAAMNAEDRRRELAGQAPGLGALVQLPQPPSAASVGISDMEMPVIGEGYDQVAEVAAAVSKAYGEDRPVYAASEVGGDGYPLGIAQTATRHVHDLGDGLLIEPGPDGRQSSGPVVTVSPDLGPRRSLLRRLLRRH